MDDSMAIRADKRKIIHMSPVAFYEGRNRLSVVALDESVAASAIASTEVEPTSLTSQYAVLLKGCLCLLFF